MSKEDESGSAGDINGGFFRGKISDGVPRICGSHYPMIKWCCSANIRSKTREEESIEGVFIDAVLISGMVMVS